MDKPSVIIVGAGAAGLVAAKELSAVFDVTVLEAQAHTGGRLHSILRDGNIIEAGAEFVHGNLPVTLGLLKAAGISYVKVAGEMYRKKKGHFTSVNEMTEGWDGLLEKMTNIKDDITMQELLDRYYPGPRHENLRRQVKSYCEGFDVADIERASVKTLGREWNAETADNYRIPAGYGALARFLQQAAEEQGAVVYPDTAVTSVQWEPGKVVVTTAGGKRFTADKLLVTVPVSILQQPASKAFIHFSPHIHFGEQVAKNIGYGAVIKIVLKFKDPFWQQDAGFILSDELFPTWWTQLPDHAPLLTGWKGGPGATELSNESDEALAEKAIASLAAIYNRPAEELKKGLVQAMVFNWQKNNYAMGAYSYDTVLSEVAKKVITTPLEQTIFFAGEALYSGDHPGTVEAALVSGMDTAALIKIVL